MALGGRTDDRQPEPRAWLAVPASPEAGEGVLLLLVSEATSLVGDAESRDAVHLLGSDRDRAALRAVKPRVLNEVRERALESGPVALDGDSLCHVGLDAWLSRGRPSDLVEPDKLRRGLGRLLPREDEQVVGEAGELLGAFLQLANELGR